MKEKIKAILSKLKPGKISFGKIKTAFKEKKSKVLVAAATIILAILLIIQLASAFNSKDRNAAKAFSNKQLVMFNLDTGQQLALDQSGKIKLPESAPVDVSKGEINFIITNIGLNDKAADKAVALPEEFILSFSPYAERSLELSQTAKDSGHSVTVDLPVQLKDGASAGNLNLTIENTDFKNQKNMEAVLSKVIKPSGVFIPHNEIFTKSANFNNVIQQIAKRKLYVIYAGDDEDIDTKAKDNDVDLVHVDVTLTDNDSTDAFKKQLAQLEATAKKNKFTIALIDNPSPEAIDAITEWYETLEDKNIEIVSGHAK